MISHEFGVVQSFKPCSNNSLTEGIRSREWFTSVWGTSILSNLLSHEIVRRPNPYPPPHFLQQPSPALHCLHLCKPQLETTAAITTAQMLVANVALPLMMAPRWPSVKHVVLGGGLDHTVISHEFGVIQPYRTSSDH